MKDNHTVDAEKAMNYGFKLAHVLHLRKSGKQHEGSSRRKIHSVLEETLQDPDADPTPALLTLYNELNPYFRNKDILIGILRMLWLVPPKSKLKKKLLHLSNRWILNVRSSRQNMLLLEHLIQAQKSNFENVREAAILMRSTRPVEEMELELLQQGRFTYPEVQTSIAMRIIDHSQMNYLEHLLSYIEHVSSTSTPNERDTQLKNIFHRLERWPSTSDFLRVLFNFYLKHSVNQYLRGWLLKLLAVHGPSLHSALVEVYKLEPDKRQATIKLLCHMVSSGQVEALRGTLELYDYSSDLQADTIRPHLRTAIQKVRQNSRVSSAFWTVYQQEMDSRSHLNTFRWTELRRDLDLHQTNSVIQVNDVPNLLNRVQSINSLQWRIRRASPDVFNALISQINDNLDMMQNEKALELASKINAVSAQQKFQTFWKVFQSHDDDTLRLKCLELMVQTGIQREAIREELYQIFVHASPELQQAIEGKWTHLFTAPLPTLGNN